MKDNQVTKRYLIEAEVEYTGRSYDYQNQTWGNFETLTRTISSGEHTQMSTCKGQVSREINYLTNAKILSYTAYEVVITREYNEVDI